MNRNCDSCNYCDYCDYCYSCDYCKNLKMSEYNLFCYSEKYNDEKSFQQKRYRAFNKEIGEERYLEITEIVNTIIPKNNKLKLQDFWKSVNQDQWIKLLEIPEAKDFKEGLEFISGQKINLKVTYSCDGKVVDIDGIKYKLKEIK